MNCSFSYTHVYGMGSLDDDANTSAHTRGKHGRQGRKYDQGTYVSYCGQASDDATVSLSHSRSS